MYATNFFEDVILNLMRGITYTPPEKTYLALFMSDPGDTGADGYEANYNGYIRQEITFSEPAAYSTGLAIENIDQIVFGESPANYGLVTHVSVMTDLNGGNMLLYGQLDTALSLQQGVTPIFRPGSIKWIFTGNLSNYYRTKVMNIIRGEACEGFLPWLGFCNGNPEGEGVEFSGYNYRRTSFVFSPPAQQENGTDMVYNVDEIVSPESSGNWGTLSYISIYDRESNGHPFAIIPLGNTFAITTQTSIGFHTGSLRFSVN